MRRNIKVVPQALEVPIEVQDADASILGGDSYCQVGKRKAMRAV